MQRCKLLALLIAIPTLFTNCDNKVDRPIVKEVAMSSSDSISKRIIQTFTLPYFDDMRFDSSSLVFYCDRAYDTSTLIEISKKNSVIRGVYYEILPNYHRFMTDYVDTSSRLIFFEGYSFVIDSTVWKSVTEQAQSLLEEKEEGRKNLKFTDGVNYALYFNGKSKHGDSNFDKPYKEFDQYLNSQFLQKFKQLRKPFMHKM